MKRILFVLATLSTGTLAIAAEGFSGWDTNGDGKLVQREVRAGFDHVGTFSYWDADGDDRLNEGELTKGLGSTGYFAQYDADGGGFLDQAELDRFGADLDTWDADDNDQVSQDELFAGLYEQWGGDEKGLTSKAFSTGFFETWDVDDDDEVTEEEFGTGWGALSKAKAATGT